MIFVKEITACVLVLSRKDYSSLFLFSLFALNRNNQKRKTPLFSQNQYLSASMNRNSFSSLLTIIHQAKTWKRRTKFRLWFCFRIIPRIIIKMSSFTVAYLSFLIKKLHFNYNFIVNKNGSQTKQTIKEKHLNSNTNWRVCIHDQKPYTCLWKRLFLSVSRYLMKNTSKLR